MDVNSVFSTFKSSRLNLVAAVAICLCAFFLLASFVDRSDAEAMSKRVNIAVRAVGHELLLRSGDSTSLVRPVIEKPNGVFLLQFEDNLAFQPDTLVAVAQRVIAQTGLTKYTVTVHECLKPVIIYGFEVNPPRNSIQPCRGRVHPKACYNIEIAFSELPQKTALNAPVAVMVSVILSTLAVVVIGRNLVAKKSTAAIEQIRPAQPQNNAETISIGQFAFDIHNQELRIGEEVISLTDKESKILSLLNRNIGQLTLRDVLIQEVWTDEGVITGRSLDMFISKLRKKLSSDPNVRITNVHGKGYRLEIA
jgi:hypothetical protein